MTPSIEPHLLRAFLKRWRLAARKQLSGWEAGEFFSRYRGRGLEFEELRSYQPGDDVRDIAWTATARLGHPIVKVNREARGRSVWLLAEDSPRLDFGFGGTTGGDPWASRAKRRTWLETLTILSQAAIHSGDRVGLAVVGSRTFLQPPSRTTLRLDMNANQPIDPWRVLERTSRRRRTVIAVADFIEPQFLDRLARIGRRHEIIAVQVIDPWERELPNVGLVRWRDASLGTTVVVDTSHPPYRRQFAEAVKNRDEQLRRRLSSLRIPRVVVRTEASAFACLAAGWPTR